MKLDGSLCSQLDHKKLITGHAVIKLAYDQVVYKANLSLLTLSACTSEDYSRSLCVCLSICLSVRGNKLRSLTPAICSAYSKHMTNARFITCGFH